jgi:hypothetical protein
MENVSENSCRENENTYYVLSHFFPKKVCHLRDNVEKYGRSGQATDDNITWQMCIACWITKAIEERLRLSRGSVLAFGTQICGFAASQSRQIFRAKKNPLHAFLRRGSKAVGPMS